MPRRPGSLATFAIPAAVLTAVFAAIWGSSAQGFVLVSGTAEAKLDVRPDQPVVRFQWDGKAPTISKKDEYEDGSLSNLDDIQAMQVLLEDAFRIWNEVPASYITLELATDPDTLADDQDGIHAIITSEIASESSAAFAFPRVEDEAIADCDVSVSNRKTSAEFLAYTIAHEIGHCLGLGHSHTNYGALMGYSRDVRSLRLGADDIAGLIYLYPHPDHVDGIANPLLPTGCGVISATGSSGSSTLYLALLLLLPVFLGRCTSTKAKKSAAKAEEERCHGRQAAKVEGTILKKTTKPDGSCQVKLGGFQSFEPAETCPLELEVISVKGVSGVDASCANLTQGDVVELQILRVSENRLVIDRRPSNQ